jgi:hypothetical protein
MYPFPKPDRNQRVNSDHLSGIGCRKGCIATVLLSIGTYIPLVVIALVIVQINYNKWIGHNIRNYSVIASRERSYDQRSYFDSYTVTVRDGRSSEQGQTWIPTIESLFEDAKNCAFLANTLECYVVEYNEYYGYPIRTFMIDSLYDYWVLSDFRPE